MREASQSRSTTVEYPMTSDRAICQAGGVWETIRTNIVIGEKKGIIDIQNAKDELGLRITGNAIYSPATKRNIMGIAIWPPSCAVVTIEPTNTYTVA